jgi:hypothetical protein
MEGPWVETERQKRCLCRKEEERKRKRERERGLHQRDHLGDFQAFHSYSSILD